MSPEQARGEELDPRADFFSFGAVLYEMATGWMAFPGKAASIIHEAILNPTPLTVSQIPLERWNLHRASATASRRAVFLGRAKTAEMQGTSGILGRTKRTPLQILCAHLTKQPCGLR